MRFSPDLPDSTLLDLRVTQAVRGTPLAHPDLRNGEGAGRLHDPRDAVRRGADRRHQRDCRPAAVEFACLFSIERRRAQHFECDRRCEDAGGVELQPDAAVREPIRALAPHRKLEQNNFALDRGRRQCRAFVDCEFRLRGGEHGAAEHPGRSDSSRGGMHRRRGGGDREYVVRHVQFARRSDPRRTRPDQR